MSVASLASSSFPVFGSNSPPSSRSFASRISPDVLGRDDRESGLPKLVFDRRVELRPNRRIGAQIGRDEHVGHRDGLDPATKLVGRDPEWVNGRCAAGYDQGGHEHGTDGLRLHG
jgi:hypothetical protein